MSATEIAEFTADRYDHIIEDMLAVELGAVDAQYAVELAETVHAVNVARHADGRPRVPLPSTVQRALVGAALGIGVSQDIPAADLVVQGVGLPLLIQCAKRDMHKRRGKGKPRHSYVTELLKDAIACEAKDRQRELHAQGMKISAAQPKALEEARAVAYARYGLSFSTKTIRRRMQNSDM